ncbi:hypothetical protein [Microbacterium aurum]
MLLATGYMLDYPFVDRAALNWTGTAPKLYLNIFPPSFNGLYVMGMVEGVRTSAGRAGTSRPSSSRRT